MEDIKKSLNSEVPQLLLYKKMENSANSFNTFYEKQLLQYPRMKDARIRILKMCEAFNGQNTNKLPNKNEIKHNNICGATEQLNTEAQADIVSIESSSQNRIDEQNDLFQEKSKSSYCQMIKMKKIPIVK